ncbi:anthranilate synthase component 1 [Caldalkalibacillus uzonensis]|uniref:Anthranilate synthase component 1 n=1 Tax=Caldalkalibacillus uzonensis TaxID=353224 RepID=A0ABU0CP32_9BACI|nr:anthranilate synthase component I [Caldalkalibacillus uzonensis]MDQ0337651.1 anthranilate synthase component 1 [Caldalkalibacillus uzonensis]
MAYPSLSEVLSLRQEYTLIPIAESIWSDNFTPTRLFQHVKGPYSFLLESVEGGAMWARYSFIGHDPFLVFRVKSGQAYLEYFEQEQTTDGDRERRAKRPVRTEKLPGDPLLHLQQLLSRYRAPASLDLPRLSGGAIGYVAYDAVSLLEKVPPHQQPVLDQDEIRLLFCDEMIAFDHLKQEVTVMGHLQLAADMDEQTVRQKYEQKVNQLRQKIERLCVLMNRDEPQAFRLPERRPDVDWDRVSSNFSKTAFTRAVEKIKSYITAGDIFQAVLSQRFTVETSVEPFDIYRVLRMVNPSPYLYYLDLGDGVQVVGSSPERLVQVENGKILVNPIAGTRRRGRTPEEDQALAEELLADEKERAEHHMLLDLGRNDVGRVARYGTVTVPKKMVIERFSHVMHIVSTVEGQVKPECHLVDCLAACFPAGTVTGAPKVRAMQIIAELEKEVRHGYSGAIGYFSFTGNMDACISIRTIFMQEGKAFIQAGAGVVADSVPELEWKETRNKARALLVAIQLAEQIFQGEGHIVHA